MLSIIATFRSDCEFQYEIEDEHDFRVSKQLRSQSSRSSLLLNSGRGYYGNDIGETDHNLTPATRNWKVVLVLNLALVVRSEDCEYLLITSLWSSSNLYLAKQSIKWALQTLSTTIVREMHESGRTEPSSQAFPSRSLDLAGNFMTSPTTWWVEWAARLHFMTTTPKIFGVGFSFWRAIS